MSIKLIEKTWDAIVVGAGPAGCGAAFFIARAGHEVLLLDKSGFPRERWGRSLII
ncbi:MAG: FAD-dependent oxidoreductase [Thermodesulfobacteriota bacterium]|nr:FAD-dependent oxidoreductase [Thermodesulfobacteriota bacterium]